jgi:cell division protein FtsB
MKYVESVIRKELSLIRENEVIYRFKDDLEKEGSDGS